MSDSILIDTNVLVYAYDRSEPQKQVQAIRILDHLTARYLEVLSTQVQTEFFMGVTKKIAAPLSLSIEETYARIENYLVSWPVLDMPGQVVLEAARGVCDHQFSYI